MSGRSRSRGSRWATARRVSTAYSRCSAADDPPLRNRASVFREPRPTKVLRLVRPFADTPLLPLIRITGFINPVGGIHDIFGRTPQLDQSVGQKRFAIDPDTGFIGMKDN
jgi:hypothetical protein